MKIIILLLIALAAAFWFFHGRGSRLSAPSSLRDAAAEVPAQAKEAIADAQTAVADAIRAPSVKSETAALARIVAGEKLREQPVAPAPAPPKPIGLTTYDRIIRGEPIIENKRAAAQ